jgi:serine/threonine-protein kinase
MQRVAAGLHVAHERGIIHRDVSPDNIIVPSGDVARAKIIDFGIARSTQLNEGTVIGSGFAGKHNYVSPEQLGLFGGNVTAKSDIYSLGLVLVQALTGRVLDMGGTQFQIIEKRRKIPDLGAIDMRFRPLLEKMLQPDPDKRPESMAAVAARSLGGTGVLGNFKSTGSRLSTPTASDAAGRGSRRWKYAVAAVLGLAVIAGAGAGYHKYGPGLLASWLAPRPTNEASLSPAGSDLTQSKSSGPARPTETKGTPAAPGSNAGSGQVAMAPAGLSRTDKIKRYVEQYDGGECFFVTPVAIGESKAAVEGFGASLQPFYGLDEAFKRDNGFAADIGVRQVTAPQCPAVTFLGRLREDRARAPRLDLEKLSLRSGETLSGTVDRVGSRNVELLLVSDGGMVQNLSSLLKPGTDAKSFSIGMQQRDGVTGSQPQLLVAVTSAQALRGLRPGRPVAAAEFFPAALSEAERSGQTLRATARYFKLEQ